jgi:hypothetical protein
MGTRHVGAAKGPALHTPPTTIVKRTRAASVTEAVAGVPEAHDGDLGRSSGAVWRLAPSSRRRAVWSRDRDGRSSPQSPKKRCLRDTFREPPAVLTFAAHVAGWPARGFGSYAGSLDAPCQGSPRAGRVSSAESLPGSAALPTRNSPTPRSCAGDPRLTLYQSDP